MAFTTRTVKLTTSGGAGVSAASAQVGVPAGVLVGVQVNYHGSAPATTDVTITHVADGVSKTVLTLTNNNTDKGMLSPLEQAVDNAGAALAGQYVNPGVFGRFQVDVAQCNDLTDAVKVTFLFEV